VLVLSGFCVLVSLAATARGVLGRLGVIPTPAPFTELFFADGQALPTYRAGTRSSFAFVIHNREGRAVTYRWAANATSDGVTSALASGSVPLGAGGAHTVHVDWIMPSSSTSMVIEVELLDLRQDIHFTVGSADVAERAVSPP
jgi:hypothetical protein